MSRLLLNPYSVTLPLALTQKGYGHAYGASATADLVMTYANVDGGSAPAAGDLVVWMAGGYDTVGDPINNLTGAGWAQGSSTWTAALDFAMTLAAKVVTAGDLSSPATLVTAPEFGSIGMWVAYTVTGAVSVLSVPALAVEMSGTAAPSNQVQNSTGLATYAVTCGVGGGTDDTPSMAMSGATADISFTTTSNVWGGGLWEDQFLVDLSAGGASITFSKGDDGLGNHMTSGYVLVS